MGRSSVGLHGFRIAEGGVDVEGEMALSGGLSDRRGYRPVAPGRWCGLVRLRRPSGFPWVLAPRGSGSAAERAAAPQGSERWELVHVAGLFLLLFGIILAAWLCWTAWRIPLEYLALPG